MVAERNNEKRRKVMERRREARQRIERRGNGKAKLGGEWQWRSKAEHRIVMHCMAVRWKGTALQSVVTA